MKLSHMNYLLEIDRHRSISAAARQLYIGQTTLSSIVKSIEDELGFRIFQRTHSGVITTPEGEEALALIWGIVSQFDDIKKFGDKARTNHFPVHLISSPTINSALAIPLVGAFLRQDARCGLVFHEVSGNLVGAKITQGEANIGLTYYTREQRDAFCSIAAKYQIQVKPLLRDRFYLIMRRDHPLAAQETVDITSLHGARLAMLAYYKVMEKSVKVIRSLPYDNRWTVFSNIALVKRAIADQNMLGILSGYVSYFDTSVPQEQLHVAPLPGRWAEAIWSSV